MNTWEHLHKLAMSYASEGSVQCAEETTEELRAAILALLAESDGPWKRVVIEKLIVSHCYKNAHEDDPEAAVNDLISWEVAVALDPCVSSDAVKLIDAEAEACAKVCEQHPDCCPGMDADFLRCADAIRARIDARKGGAKP